MRITPLVFSLFSIAAGLSPACILVDPIHAGSDEGDSAPSCLLDKDCAKKPNRYCRASVESPAVRCGGAFTMKQPGQCAVIPTGVCAKDVQPVCGCDGKVYASGCLAEQTQKANRNVSNESPHWQPSKDAAIFTHSWQTAPMMLESGGRSLVLRYVFTKAGSFELQTFDPAHMELGPATTKSGNYVVGGGALKLIYPDELDGNGVAHTGDLVVEQLCSDGFRISGHDGLPNTDLELQRNP